MDTFATKKAVEDGSEAGLGLAGQNAPSNDRVRSEIALLIRECEALRRIAADFHWMARRYADGRSSYVTGLFNDHTRALLAMGVELNPTGDGTIWARDAMGRAYDGLTDDEAAQGSPMPRGLHDEDVARLRQELEGVRRALEIVLGYVPGPEFSDLVGRLKAEGIDLDALRSCHARESSAHCYSPRATNRAENVPDATSIGRE